MKLIHKCVSNPRVVARATATAARRGLRRNKGALMVAVACLDGCANMVGESSHANVTSATMHSLATWLTLLISTL